MQPLETKLDELLVKKAPFQIPKEAREGIVKAMPWITLIGGVLMLAAVWGLWQLLSWANNAVTIANGLGMYYNVGYVAPTGMWAPLAWVSLLILLAQAIVFFVAYPGLAARKKSAWNLLFYVAILNAVQAVLQFVGYTNFGTLLLSLVGSVVGLYILFQIRGHYTGEPLPVTGGTAPLPPKKIPTPSHQPIRSNI